MAACGVILFASGLVSSFGDRRPAEASAVIASVTQTRALAITNSLDSRFRPDGLPIVVPAPSALSV